MAKLSLKPIGVEQIVEMLRADGESERSLLARAAEVKERFAGEGTYLRGLIEFSNVCRKNCLYCGIRRDADCERYTLTPERVLGTVREALERGYMSFVLQGGENTSEDHIATIEYILQQIATLSEGRAGVTLSFGEQTPATYRRWRQAGAHRYLLRIESSDPELYGSLHPSDGLHDHETRLQSLAALREAGYQVGTGVMVGLPGQSLENLARDLLFMRDKDIDMCGMGPYVESAGTPLAASHPVHRTTLPPVERLRLTVRMIAILRLMMPDINIAAATALEAIDPAGRAMALGAGANVLMQNITPDTLRPSYALYDNKPFKTEPLPENIRLLYGQSGDPAHYHRRAKK